METNGKVDGFPWETECFSGKLGLKLLLLYVSSAPHVLAVNVTLTSTFKSLLGLKICNPIN